MWSNDIDSFRESNRGIVLYSWQVVDAFKEGISKDLKWMNYSNHLDQSGLG